MNQSTKALSGVTVTPEELRAYLSDMLGCYKEAKGDQLHRFNKWLVLDYKGTVAVYSPVPRRQALDAYTDLPEAAGPNMLRGMGLIGIVSAVTDAYDAVMMSQVPEAIYEKERTYRLTEASTVEEYGEQALATTTERQRPEEVEEQVDTLFQAAKEQDFEDGVESGFSRELLSLIREYDNLAMQEIGYLITYDRVNREVSSEALRWLGHMKDPVTYGWRLWLLEKSLTSASPQVRDGAALGLASMGDPHAIQYIREAIARETCTELREDMEQVLEDLEAACYATFAKEDTQV